METIVSLVAAGFFLLLGVSFGRWREQAHLASLDEREAQHRDMLVTNLRIPTNPESVASATLVGGDVVIASDYFKTFVSSYRKLIGGEMRAYETLVRRARREATLRVIEEARALGATEVWNVRVELARIGTHEAKGGVMCEAFAYGTAITRKR